MMASGWGRSPVLVRQRPAPARGTRSAPETGIPAVAIGLFGAVAAAIGEVLVAVARQGARLSRLRRRRE